MNRRLFELLKRIEEGALALQIMILSRITAVQVVFLPIRAENMKKFLLFLVTVAALTIGANAQSNPVDDFFHWSPGIPQKYVEHWGKTQLDYFLATSVKEGDPIVQRCFKAGMVSYGYSAFWGANRGGWGTPRKVDAIIYGQEIGAACVVYLVVSTIQDGERGTGHTIYFYGWPPTGRKR